MLQKKISSKSVIMLFCGSTQLASQAFLTNKIPLSKRTASTASAPPPNAIVCIHCFHLFGSYRGFGREKIRKIAKQNLMGG